MPSTSAFSITLAAAQTASAPGDILANLATHLRFVDVAHSAGVQVLLFPELSLSGYEPTHVATCTVTPQDARLAPLRDKVRATGMVVIVGAPVPNDTLKPAIGAITFFPDGTHSVYRKQHLHPGEDAFASPCPHAPTIAKPTPSQTFAYLGERIGQGVCADITHAQHPALAAQAGATLYLAGVLESTNGYAANAPAMQSYAIRHRMGTLMANHGGNSGGYVTAGQSAFWAPTGECVAKAPGPGAYLVIARKAAPTNGGSWSGEVLAV
ncbi:carbon-nitrogen hydrolase family protein [Rhodoferax aquaticus]|uniref:Carbon-nitrogen hydrolase family protein n=1 Tax=Rhodoferax aquaticus TaxID=2527691 RepID=A0A515ENN2_9BURK|nr:carbon-nitrogen hydrolase family protein [Rhodoferax aquaticus]QDL54269.1 carbon-nitrogen hydrolase family protein [Rhodoferax aquaticus]